MVLWFPLMGSTSLPCQATEKRGASLGPSLGGAGEILNPEVKTMRLSESSDPRTLESSFSLLGNTWDFYAVQEHWEVGRAKAGSSTLLGQSGRLSGGCDMSRAQRGKGEMGGKEPCWRRDSREGVGGPLGFFLLSLPKSLVFASATPLGATYFSPFPRPLALVHASELLP